MNESWYPRYKFSNRIERYLKLVGSTFNVLNANKEWVPYELTNHQREWHAKDVAVLGEYAKSRVVVKSRNTSFTVSTLISNLTDVPNFPNKVVPLVRLNITRAQDLISDCKELIRKMNVVELEDGRCWPFNKDKVEMKNVNSIKFPNGVEFRAFPANAQAAEVIRGLRIAGNAGIVDESNFMRDFENIYIALRDASAGSELGRKCFQMNIGTTLKGRATPFNLWYEKIKEKQILDIYSWPVFDPEKFDISQSVFEQDVTPIVRWHSLEDLENKRKEDKNRFLEEYMAQLVDSEEQFYPYVIILKSIDDDLKETFKTIGNVWMGIDVASVNDYFVISVFEEIDGIFYQRFLKYIREVDLTEMEEEIHEYIRIFKPFKVRIDANGIGFQISQALRKRYGNMVDPIRGARLKGIFRGENVKTNEFIHTNQKRLMTEGKLKLFNDEMQINHYTVWDYSYEASSTKEFGHGDITMANGYALLPLDYRRRKALSPMTSNKSLHNNETDISQMKRPEVDW